jgi:hypothetical protein
MLYQIFDDARPPPGSTCAHILLVNAIFGGNKIIISGSNRSKTDNNKTKSKHTTPSFHPFESCVYSLYPMDDPSCQDNTWYDAISPYDWTGGMIWDGAYVINHQVVSVTTYPIFVSNLPPDQELSATIQAPEARSEDKNDGPRGSLYCSG